jgi:hypothetical protein
MTHGINSQIKLNRAGGARRTRIRYRACAAPDVPWGGTPPAWLKF